MKIIELFPIILNVFLFSCRKWIGWFFFIRVFFTSLPSIPTAVIFCLLWIWIWKGYADCLVFLHLAITRFRSDFISGCVFWISSNHFRYIHFYFSHKTIIIQHCTAWFWWKTFRNLKKLFLNSEIYRVICLSNNFWLYHWMSWNRCNSLNLKWIFFHDFKYLIRTFKNNTLGYSGV